MTIVELPGWDEGELASTRVGELDRPGRYHDAALHLRLADRRRVLVAQVRCGAGGASGRACGKRLPVDVLADPDRPGGRLLEGTLAIASAGTAPDAYRPSPRDPEGHRRELHDWSLLRDLGDLQPGWWAPVNCGRHGTVLVADAVRARLAGGHQTVLSVELAAGGGAVERGPLRVVQRSLELASTI